MDATPNKEFQPHWLLRNAHLQSLITGLGVRRALIRMRPNPMLAASREYLLECGEGVRLQGFYTPQPDGTTPRGLVWMLHGWEGNAESTYMLSMGRRLFRDGYEVFRLNFRDHGDTHHLNEGIFHSCRINEVVGAVREMARRIPTRPLLTVGFSLGGNFALRLAVRAPESGIPLTRTVAVNPPIDPAKSLAAMDAGLFVYRRYFMQKWRRSLLRKQACFPGRYDFDEWFRLGTLGEMTDHLAREHAGFASAAEYFDGYSVAGDRLRDLRVPTTVITAADDPIIPVCDYYELVRPEALKLEIHRYGGHCGYFSGPLLHRWIEDRVKQELDATAQEYRQPALVV